MRLSSFNLTYLTSVASLPRCVLRVPAPIWHPSAVIPPIASSQSPITHHFLAGPNCRRRQVTTLRPLRRITLFLASLLECNDFVQKCCDFVATSLSVLPTLLQCCDFRVDLSVRSQSLFVPKFPCRTASVVRAGPRPDTPGRLRGFAFCRHSNPLPSGTDPQ